MAAININSVKTQSNRTHEHKICAIFPKKLLILFDLSTPSNVLNRSLNTIHNYSTAYDPSLPTSLVHTK